MDINGKEGLKEYYEGTKKAFPDATYTLDDAIAEYTAERITQITQAKLLKSASEVYERVVNRIHDELKTDKN